MTWFHKMRRIRYIIIISAACIVSVLLIWLWSPVRSLVVEQHVSASMERLCTYDHLSVQITQSPGNDPAAGHCTILTKDIDFRKLIGSSSGINISAYANDVRYAFDLVMKSPDKKENLDLQVYKINDIKMCPEALRDTAFTFDEGFYLTVASKIICTSDAKEAERLIKMIVSMDTKFSSDIIYNTFFH